MKGGRLMAICSWQPNGRKSNVCRYAIITTSAEHVNGKVRSTTPFGHALLDKLVYVVNFSEIIQALNTRQNMVWETFPDSLLVVNTALMRNKMLNGYDEICDPKPILIVWLASGIVISSKQVPSKNEIGSKQCELAEPIVSPALIVSFWSRSPDPPYLEIFFEWVLKSLCA